MPDIEIRDATRDDLIAFYGRAPDRTAKAMVAIEDGTVAAVFGVAYWGHGRPPVMFSDLAPGFGKRHPMVVVRSGRKMLKRWATVPLLTLQDKDEPSAPRFLAHMGFEHVCTSAQGEIWRYDPRRMG